MDIIPITQAKRGRPPKHGHRPANGKPSPTYYSWRRMNERCHNPKHKSYGYYGARGISVCSRWRNSFQHFLDDMGPRPEGKTIDRIELDKNYEPGNCRWATAIEQNRHQRRYLPIAA
jgi:hypothetical protein